MSESLSIQGLAQPTSRRNPLLVSVRQPFTLHVMVSLAVLGLALPVALFDTHLFGSVRVRFVVLALSVVYLCHSSGLDRVAGG